MGAQILHACQVVNVVPACMQVVNVELHNIMRMAHRDHYRYHSPLNATLQYNDEQLVGGTLLKQILGVEVDVPGCVAAVESAVMQAAFEQTDRVNWEWGSQDPVNASMYSTYGHLQRAFTRTLRRPH